MRHTSGWAALVIALLVGIVAALVLGTWQLVEKNRPAPVPVADQSDARTEVMEFVTTNIEKVLSYTPRTDEIDIADIATMLTGKAAANFRDEMRSRLSVARINGVTQTSKVRNIAVESLSTDKAELLAFIDQTTTSTGNRTRAQHQFATRVGVAKVDDTWLIDAVNQL